MIDTHLHVSKNPHKFLMRRGVCVIKSSQFRAFYRVRCQLRCWVSNLFVAGYILNVRILLLCAVFRRDCRWLHFDLNGFNVYWSLPQQNPFNLSPRVSWGGIKNQSKSTWCQSALIQFSINKTFQTALKMAHRKFMYLLNVTGREIIWQLFIWWQLWKKFL